MTPPQSPSVTQTALQQQQTIPVGQQVALVTSQITTTSSHVNTQSLRSSTPTVPPSAISSSQIVIAPNNKLTTVAQKSNPALLIHQKEGSQILMGHPASLAQNIRPNVQMSVANTIQNSLALTQTSAANIQIASPSGGIMLGPRHQQPIQLQQLAAGQQTAGPNHNNILQFVNVNSPSRPTLTVPPSSVTGTSVATYSAANIFTGSNATIQGNQKNPLAPRVVQLPPNVRLSPHVVRQNAPGFSSPVFSCFFSLMSFVNILFELVTF